MKGVLMVNLGSPETTDPKDVKKYLGEFLMDGRVIDVPQALRSFLVKGIILNTRPKKAAKAYSKIWWDEGSPLIVLSERLQEKVDKNTSVPISLGMRYGKPSIYDGLKELHEKGVDEVMLMPLYPQYAMATTETIVVLAEELRNEHFPDMRFKIVPPFHDDKDYTRVLGNSISEKLEQIDYDYLMFSYHGIPERHIRKSDITKSHCKIDGSCCQTPSIAHEHCYRHQCFKTTENVAEYLKLEEGTYGTSFQSRLGFDPWLRPYTDKTIEAMAKKGVKKIAVVTPAFVSDCLETLEEIGMEGKEIFEENGGEEFTFISCINDRQEWVDTLSKWIDEWAFKEQPVEKEA